MLTIAQSQELSRLAGLLLKARERAVAAANGFGAPGESVEGTFQSERKANAEFHDYLRALTFVPHPGDTDSLSDEEFIRLADEQYGRDGEIEFDGNARVSRGNEPFSGAFVQAWVWVDLPEKEKT